MDIKIQLQKLMADMNKNIKDQEDLKYVQENFIKTLADMLQKMDNENKSNQNRISKLEEKVLRMEKEFFVTDSYDIEIVCPYCNYQFETEFDEDKKEVKCPECHNVIELDWSSEDDCDSKCDSCHGCHGHHNNQDLDDDM